MLSVLEYIDDAIILAEYPETLQEMLREVEYWAFEECLEISINPSNQLSPKRGVVPINRHEIIFAKCGTNKRMQIPRIHDG